MGIFNNKSRLYKEDTRGIKCGCDLYILMDVLNLRQLEFLVNMGYKISGIFTNLEQLELELATNMGKFRLLVVDSGCGNFGNSETLVALNNVISLCIEGNKCMFLTNNKSLICSLERASVENYSSLMIREYNGILSIYNVLEGLGETYIGSSSLGESLSNCIDMCYNLKLDLLDGVILHSIKDSSVDLMGSSYSSKVRGVLGKLSSGDLGIKAYDDIRY